MEDEIIPDEIIPEQVIESFIETAKELSRSPSSYLMILQTCAKELCKVCKELLLSVENLKRWFTKFLYFTFDSFDSRVNVQERFFELVSEYRALKQSDINELRISNSTIENLRNKLERDLRSLSAGHELYSLEESLILMNNPENTVRPPPTFGLVSHITLSVVGSLNKYVESVEPIVDVKDYNKAEKMRLDFKKETKNQLEIIESLEEKFTDLVERFAGYSHITICLSRAAEK